MKNKKDEMDEFVSDGAYEVMEEKMLKKDFIGERGFMQFISPFKEVIKKRVWSLLCEHKSFGYVALVREFYSNIVERKEKTFYVRGKWISFNKNEIKKTTEVEQPER